MGGGVNLTPYQYFGTSSPGGPPYRMLLDNGIPVGLSSDGMQIAPVPSGDYFSAADEDLKKLHSELTVLGGTVVHSGAVRYWA